MTPEDLTQLIERGQESALANALSRLEERQRSKLSATAQKLYRKYRRESGGTPHAQVAHLAMMGTGPLSMAEKYDPHSMDYSRGLYSAAPAADRRFGVATSESIGERLENQ